MKSNERDVADQPNDTPDLALSDLALKEAARSAVLHRYAILDTPREADFDDIAALAAEVCETPIAVVNFIDTHRQFFKAEVGLGVRETPLETSFCGQAILAEDMLVVPDAQEDERFNCNPLVTEGGLRFYSGALLKTREGVPIGTICVLDYKPRDLTAHQIRTLTLLARQAMTQLDLRYALSETKTAEARHQQVMDSSLDYAIISMDLAGNVTGWNKGAEAVLGWTEEEMLGHPAAIMFNPIDRSVGVPDREMKAAAETGRGTDERWHLRKDGSRFFALGEMMPLRDRSGQHTGYVKILRDRTQERRQTQRLAILAEASSALLDSKDPAATLRPILEGGADTIGFEHCYLYDLGANDQLLLRQSVGADEETQMALRQVGLDGPICGLVVESNAPVILSGLQCSDDPRHQVGRSVGLRAYAGYPIRIGADLVGVISFGTTDADSFDAQTLSFFQTVARFISISRGRAEIESNLLAAERRSRLSQEAAGIGTFELDVATCETMVSSEFCRIFGVPPRPSYPSSMFEERVVEKDKTVRSSFLQRQTGMAPLDVEYRIRSEEFGERWILRQAEFIRDVDGQVRSMVGTIQDVTDRKVAALRQDALLQLGDRLRQTSTRQEIATAACEALLDTLHVSRAGHSRIDTAQSQFVVEHDYCPEDAPTITGGYPLSAFEQTLACLERNRVLVSNDIAQDPALDREAAGYLAIGIAALIKVPLFTKGEITGLIFVHQDKPRVWSDTEIDFVRRVADRVYAALAQSEAEAEQAILNQELSHRLKNSLSMVQALASQTLRKTVEPEALDGFLRRVHVLSSAHDILLHRNWEAAAIDEVIRSTIETVSQAGRVGIGGPEVQLGPRTTLTLSMLLHELATNALKYGALSNDIGTVDINWTIETGEDSPDLVLMWREAGGPPVTSPSRKGFGSRLISLGLTGTGGVERRYDPSGVTVVIKAPLTHVQQS